MRLVFEISLWRSFSSVHLCFFSEGETSSGMVAAAVPGLGEN